MRRLLNGTRNAIGEGTQFFRVRVVSRTHTRRTHEYHRRIGDMSLEPRTNARQIAYHNTATTSQRLDNNQRQPLKIGRKHEDVSILIGAHQFMRFKAARKFNSSTAGSRLLGKALIFGSIVMPAHQAKTQLFLGDLNLVDGVKQTPNALLFPNLANV